MLLSARLRAIVVAGVALAGPPVLVALLSTPPAVRWTWEISVAVEGWTGGWWRLFRGGLAWLAAPATLVVVVSCFVWMFRAGRARTAVLATVLALGSFLTSEAYKLGLVDLPGYGPDGDRDISGHVAMIAGAVIVVVLAARRPWRRTVAVLGVGVLVLTSLGVVVARWHDGGDVLVPVAVAIAWVVLARTVLILRRARPAGPRRVPVALVVATGAAIVCAAGATILVIQLIPGHSMWPLLAVLLASAAAAIVTATACLGLADTLEHSAVDVVSAAAVGQ